MGELPLARITPELVAHHLHALETGGHIGSTVNRYRSCFGMPSRRDIGPTIIDAQWSNGAKKADRMNV